MRFWLTAGPGGFSFSPDECTEPGFYVALFDKMAGVDFDPRAGIAEATVDIPMKPPLLAGIKSNNYLLNVLTHLAARDAGGHFGE